MACGCGPSILNAYTVDCIVQDMEPLLLFLKLEAMRRCNDFGGGGG